MQLARWNKEKIKQCEQQTGLALLHTNQALLAINQDFGRTHTGSAAAVFKANDLASLQKLLQFTNRHKLPVTIRANGLSQAGQSLAPEDVLSVDISSLNAKIEWRHGQLTAGCSASFKDIIKTSLKHDRLPYVYPYNTSLTTGGVLAVGGLGSSTFKEGIIASHVEKLSVVTAAGDLLTCSKERHPDLFKACLSGAGLFGIIYDASFKLRPCGANVYIQTLKYDNYQLWLDDQLSLKNDCDYLEAFVVNETPGTGEKECIIQLGIEYDTTPPDMTLIKKLHYAQLGDTKEQSIVDYTNRHDARLNLMKETGAWSLVHPWYECYVESSRLRAHIEEIVSLLDDKLPGIYHIFPVERKAPYFFKLPKGDKVLTFNILHPGLQVQEAHAAISAIQKVDELLLKLGGKRYISGWFANDLQQDYWLTHYGDKWKERQEIKQKYDPFNIFQSNLFTTV